MSAPLKWNESHEKEKPTPNRHKKRLVLAEGGPVYTSHGCNTPNFLAFPETGADLLFGLALPVDLLDSTTSKSRQQLRNSGRNDLVAASQPCS